MFFAAAFELINVILLVSLVCFLDPFGAGGPGCDAHSWTGGGAVVRRPHFFPSKRQKEEEAATDSRLSQLVKQRM